MVVVSTAAGGAVVVSTGAAGTVLTVFAGRVTAATSSFVQSMSTSTVVATSAGSAIVKSPGRTPAIVDSGSTTVEQSRFCGKATTHSVPGSMPSTMRSIWSPVSVCAPTSQTTAADEVASASESKSRMIVEVTGSAGASTSSSSTSSSSTTGGAASPSAGSTSSTPVETAAKHTGKTEFALDEVGAACTSRADTASAANVIDPMEPLHVAAGVLSCRSAVACEVARTAPLVSRNSTTHCSWS